MSNPSDMSADTLATAVAQKMYESDEASRHLGIALKEVGPGYAVMTMRVDPYMLNGHKTCHGGYMFLLADSAFAFACNTYNQKTVAQAAQINFLKPVAIDTLLTATAKEVSRTGRTGLYDIDVTNEEGALVATFRGNSHTVKGQHLPDPTENKEE